jgi:hypothetical protein
LEDGARKFHPDVKKFMEETASSLIRDTNRVDEGYSPDTIAKVGFRDAIVGRLKKISENKNLLVRPRPNASPRAGEALANGCIPVTLESSGKEQRTNS